MVRVWAEDLHFMSPENVFVSEKVASTPSAQAVRQTHSQTSVLPD